jgi:hypothetical protein
MVDVEGGGGRSVRERECLIDDQDTPEGTGRPERLGLERDHAQAGQPRFGVVRHMGGGVTGACRQRVDAAVNAPQPADGNGEQHNGGAGLDHERIIHDRPCDAMDARGIRRLGSNPDAPTKRPVTHRSCPVARWSGAQELFRANFAPSSRLSRLGTAEPQVCSRR